MHRLALRSSPRCVSRWIRPNFHQKHEGLRFPAPFKSYSTSQAAELQDEYNDSIHDRAFSNVFRVSTPFQLENGCELNEVDVAYTTYGTLNDARDNVLVVCHAFAGQSQVHQWWDGVVADEWTDKYFLVCTNVLGSCYGTTGPTSINPMTGVPYGASFPAITVRDAVRLQIKLLKEGLGIPQIRAVIGGSLGGMQTLEWAFLGGPDYVKSFVAIACNSHHTAWQIGVSEVQRQAIYMDPRYQNGFYDPMQPPAQGLALARQIAMISYRTHAAYDDKYGRDVVSTKDDVSSHPYFQVQSYLNYQGQKIVSRFDANTYVTLTHLMDTHDVGRGRGGVSTALSTLQQPALILGIDSDVLYPLTEQQFLAHHLPNAEFHAVESPHGHDGFILEQDTICAHALAFIDQQGN